MALRNLAPDEEAAVCLACTLPNCCGGESRYCLLNEEPVTERPLPSKTAAERRAYRREYYRKNQAKIQEYMRGYMKERSK